MMRIFPIIVLSFFIFNTFYSQNVNEEEFELDTIIIKESLPESEEIFEEIFENSIEDSEDENAINYIEELSKNKININKASFSELSNLPFVSSQEAKAIIKYRDVYGNFKSIYEIYNIKDLSYETARKLILFINVYDDENFPIEKNIFQDFYKKTYLTARNRVQIDLQERKGFKDNKFKGDRLKSYHRFVFNSMNNYQFGVLIDKDPGEQSYYDFYSFHFAASNLPYIKKIALGDFIFEHGLGLALWSPYALVNSNDAANNIKPRERGIVPYTSADENKFFRGLGLTANLFKDFSISVFYSKNTFDASIDTLTNQIKSIPQDGYHRTESEISKKKIAEEQTYVVALSNEKPNQYEISFLYMRNELSHPIQKKETNYLYGDIFNTYSLAYKTYFLPMTYFFGETAFDGDALATLNGMQISPSRNLSYLISLRYYSPKYNSLKSASFGQNSSISNEIGFYNGFKLRFKPIGYINFYYDIYKFPSSTFSSLFPIKGNSFYIDLVNNTLLKKTIFNIRYRRKDKESATLKETTKKITNEIKDNYRFEITYEPFNIARFRTRVEFTTYQVKKMPINENGYLIFQDVRLKPFQNLSLYFRYIIYETDSYNSRLYQFEQDIPGVMTNKAVYGKGSRFYIVTRYKALKNLELSFKYSETFKPFERTISSGLTEIDNNIDNKFSFQIDWKL